MGTLYLYVPLILQPVLCVDRGFLNWSVFRDQWVSKCDTVNFTKNLPKILQYVPLLDEKGDSPFFPFSLCWNSFLLLLKKETD